MPLSLKRGTVTAVVERLEGLARIEVDGVPCVAYPRLTGPVALGDEVIVNVQGRELGLGSGGFDILCVNLTRGLDLAPEPGAHVMTLPYSPVQAAMRYVEEEAELAETLGGMPVVCCSLHSQVAPACAGIGQGMRVAYVQLGGGALPVSLSDAVRALKERGLVEVAVAAGACFDGDAQAVGVVSALAWAVAQGFEAAVCAVGPGIVGTASARPRRRTRRALWPARPCLPFASRTAMRESGIEACPTTPARLSGSASARSPWPGRPAWRLLHGSPSTRRSTSPAGARPVPGCRSSTWAAARRRIPGSSPPRSPPADWLGSSPARWSSAASARSSGSERGTRSMPIESSPAAWSALRSKRAAGSSTLPQCMAQRRSRLPLRHTLGK